MTKIHTAMLLSAGLGTRMKPLTDTRPKPLVEVGGRTLVDRVLDKLVLQGVTRAIVNVHHFADQMENHLKARTDIESTRPSSAVMFPTMSSVKAAVTRFPSRFSRSANCVDPSSPCSSPV